jgi:hypothetical protein
MQPIPQQLESQSAISACMSALGRKSRTAQSFKAEAMFRRPNESFCLGNVDVSFDNLDPLSGIELNCDREIMSGFGIRHGNFNSKFQIFTFDQVARELCITDANYSFIFRF